MHTDTLFATYPFIEDFFPFGWFESAGVLVSGRARIGSVGGIRPGETKSIVIPGELSTNVIYYGARFSTSAVTQNRPMMVT